MKNFLKTLATSTILALTTLGGITFFFALSVVTTRSFLELFGHMFVVSKGNMRLVVFGVLAFIIIYCLIVITIRQHKELKKRKW